MVFFVPFVLLCTVHCVSAPLRSSLVPVSALLAFLAAWRFRFRASHSCYNNVRAVGQCRRSQLQVVRYRDGGVARLGILEGEIVRAAGGELFGELLPREHIGP